MTTETLSLGGTPNQTTTTTTTLQDREIEPVVESGNLVNGVTWADPNAPTSNTFTIGGVTGNEMGADGTQTTTNTSTGSGNNVQDPVDESTVTQYTNLDDYLLAEGYDPNTGTDGYGRSLDQIMNDILLYGANAPTKEERLALADAAQAWINNANGPYTQPDQNGMGDDGGQRTPTNVANDGNDDWTGSGSHDPDGNPYPNGIGDPSIYGNAPDPRDLPGYQWTYDQNGNYVPTDYLNYNPQDPLSGADPNFSGYSGTGIPQEYTSPTGSPTAPQMLAPLTNSISNLTTDVNAGSLGETPTFDTNGLPMGDYSNAYSGGLSMNDLAVGPQAQEFQSNFHTGDLTMQDTAQQMNYGQNFDLGMDPNARTFDYGMNLSDLGMDPNARTFDGNINFGDLSQNVDAAQFSADGLASLRDVDILDTVQGQLQGLLSTDNPLVRQARLRAEQEAASRGLNNSTMALQAGEEAAFASMMPVAQQDATTYFQQGLTNQAAQNEFGLRAQDANIQGGLLQQQGLIDNSMQNNAASISARLAAQRGGIDSSLAEQQGLIQNILQNNAGYIDSRRADQDAGINSSLEEQRGLIQNYLQNNQGTIQGSLADQAGTIDSYLRQQQSQIDNTMQNNAGALDSRLRDQSAGIDSRLMDQKAMLDNSLQSNQGEITSRLADQAATQQSDMFQQQAYTDNQMQANRAEIDAQLAQQRLEAERALTEQRLQAESDMLKNQGIIQNTLATNQGNIEAQLSQQRYEQQEALADQNFKQQSVQSYQDYAEESMLTKEAYENQYKLNEQQYGSDYALQQLKNQVLIDTAYIEAENKLLIQSSADAAQLYAQHMESIESLYSSMSSEGASAEQLSAGLADLQRSFKESMSFIGAANDMTSEYFDPGTGGATGGGTNETVVPDNVNAGDSIQGNTDAINSIYQMYLGREADPGGLEYWSGQEMTADELISRITNSTEYAQLQANGEIKDDRTWGNHIVGGTY